MTPISDRQVVAVLRPFVRAAGQVTSAMRAPGRSAGLRSVKLPGSPEWPRLTVRARTIWWIDRVGRLTALVTSVPGLGGALADRLPVQDALGAAAQGLLLCAIAEEHGVHDLGERVRLLAWVLFQRDVDPEVAAGNRATDVETAEAAKLSGELGSKRRISPRLFAGALWRMARSLLAIGDELEKRPRGHFYQRALGVLPVVGMFGDYRAERSAQRRVARDAGRWLTART